MMTKEERNVYMREYFKMRRSRNICLACGLPAEPGKTRCTYCKDKNNLTRRIKYAEAKAAALAAAG